VKPGQTASGTGARLHHALFSVGHWRARVLLWIAAAAVGLAAVGFARLADLAHVGLRAMLRASPWWIWVTAPLGFGAIAWLTRRFFRGAEGSGIPQTIFALRPDAGGEGIALLRLRVVLGRITLAAASLLCGASIGREGPTVHVGAAIVHVFGRWMPHATLEGQRRSLILAGGAAGVAAAFNTPLAGIVFAIEELSRSFEERASGTTLTAVILAGLVAIVLVGDYTYFGQPAVSTSAQSLHWMTLAVALVTGLAGATFSRVMLWSVRALPGMLRGWRERQPVLFALVCGLLVAAIGTLCGGTTYGTGYEEARSIIMNGAQMPLYYGPARAFATLLSYLSGVPAGILAPSLSVGAGLGQSIAVLCGQGEIVPLAILGMCGYLAGVTQAPLTSFVIVMEMTAQHGMVLPLMASAAVATAVSRLLTPPLYQTLASRYATTPSPAHR
jgi:H+/Cl- antiporter ClcA